MTSHHDRIEAVTASLIRRAVRTAPAELAERLEEEWLADLATRHHALARLRLALGCLWATQVIAHDFVVSGAATGAATPQRNMVMALGPDGVPFSKRTMVLLLIVALHVAGIYAFANGFVTQVFERPAKPMVVKAFPPSVKPPSNPLPRLDQDRASDRVLRPDVSIPVDPIFPTDVAPPTVTDGPGPVELPAVPPTSPPAVRRISGGPSGGFPNTDDYYPPAAIRGHQEGVTAVQVCLDERGRLLSDPTLVRSSGFPLLDDGALKLAKAGAGHYRASTQNGRPVSDCFAYLVRYKLKQ